MTDAPSLTPLEARDRWLDKLRVQRRERTVYSYEYRLKLFVEWAEEQGIDDIRDLSGWDLETYEAHRRSKDPTASTLNNEFQTLRLWLEYLARIEVVDADLPDKVDVPDVPKDEETNTTRLEYERALEMIQQYRKIPKLYGTRDHVLLEIAWHTGARVGGIRALDLRDVKHTEMENGETAHFVEFVNRPETDTPLKNGPDGERPVALLPEVYEVIDHYISVRRPDKVDDEGRQPLLVSQRGRPSAGTIRIWMYKTTLPCRYGPCPHDRDPDECQYTKHNHRSKCPSSVSPHPIRTGAITWMRNQGLPVEVVAERVNASVDVINKHYDVEEPLHEMLRRRVPHLNNLSFDPDSTDQ